MFFCQTYLSKTDHINSLSKGKDHSESQRALLVANWAVCRQSPGLDIRGKDAVAMFCLFEQTGYLKFPTWRVISLTDLFNKQALEALLNAGH